MARAPLFKCVYHSPASPRRSPRASVAPAVHDAERRPIAWLRHQQIFARRDYARWATAEEKVVLPIDDEAMDLGQLYRSSAVIGAGPELPPALQPEQRAGQPGKRAPHLWLERAGQRLSMVDLLQRGWVLLTEARAGVPAPR